MIMHSASRKKHWEQIYKEREDRHCSWYEQVPQVSLKLIEEFYLPPNASVIDIGGGNSRLALELFRKGFSDLTVLDISGRALERSRQRMISLKDRIHWVHSDVLQFKTDKKFTVWHDRATFHFLTSQKAIDRYCKTASRQICEVGYMILATFSNFGPDSCSGLPIRQYDESALKQTFEEEFNLISTREAVHLTPTGKEQHFIYAVFQKKQEGPGKDELVE